MLNIKGYDTETWCSNPISEGLETYFADPNFEIICAGYASDSGIIVEDEITNGNTNLHPIGGHDTIFVAHNMPFDRWAVAAHSGKVDHVRWFDSMIAVRAILGASLGRNSYISLDKAAKLLLPPQYHKDANGAELMPYFSFPSPKNNFGKKSWRQMRDMYRHLWDDYLKYCGQDAEVARQLALLAQSYLGEEAFERLVVEAEITYRMNRTGWPVDQHLLQVMTDRAQENTETSLDRLIEEFNPGFSSVVKKTGEEKFTPINLNSGVQLKKWLSERDIDVDNTQADTILETLEFVEDNLDNRPDWAEVAALLQAKVDLGGATLKKLTPIKNGLWKDGRLHDQYNHIAAAATHRTTGGGAQLQNLKQLPDDVEDLTEEMIGTLNNGELARNIRQLFIAEEGGEIIVADLKSIEGLLVGWVFGVDWMVKAVRDGLDMYKMSAAERFGVPYVSVLPQQRKQAKTGVLAGNYGGSTKAYVKASGGSLSDEDASRDVKAYRDTVPNLVQSWWDLNDMLIECVEEGNSGLRLYNGYSVVASMHPGIEDAGGDSMEITLMFQGRPIFSRWWHGVQIEEDENDRKEITYALAEEKKTATTKWKRLTSDGEKYRLYGGKLTGTLIQSLARELYFYQLNFVAVACGSSIRLIGQLHDEVVAEWRPSDPHPLDEVEASIEQCMTQVPWYLAGCPVRVKVSHAKRYIK